MNRIGIAIALAFAFVVGLVPTFNIGSAFAASGPVFTVMNTSETPPDGIYFRNSPAMADTSRTYGLGVFMNEQVRLECFVSNAEPVGPYSNRLWYFVSNVTRPVNYNGQTNEGMLNGHFINDGAASNVVDAGVPACVNNRPPVQTSAPSVVTLSQGPAAPAGYRYAVSLSGFAPNSSVSVTCFDSVSPNGFYSFSLGTNAAGAASTQAYCYSADGPDHWVVANGVVSNHVQWGPGAGASGGSSGSASGSSSGAATTPNGIPGGGLNPATYPGSTTTSTIPASSLQMVDGVQLGSAINGWHAYGPRGTCVVRDYNSPNNGHVMVIKYNNNTYHVVHDGMLYGWWDNGGASGQLGCAVGPETSSTTVAGRRFAFQQFEHGWLYWTNGSGKNDAVIISESSLRAIMWAWRFLGQSVYEHKCLEFVVNAYNIGGQTHLTGGPYGDNARAYQWWTSRSAAEQHAGDVTPPPGAFAIWQPAAAKDGSGHIVLSIGNGYAISTETDGTDTAPVYLLNISSWNRNLYFGWVAAR